DWQPVGHPDKKGERTGTPAVAVDARGRAHVFVATAAGGIGLLAQKEKGGWEPWRMLDTEEEAGRAGVRGAPAAVTAASGRIEVYAAVRGGIRHWAQPEPGAPPVPGDSVEVPVRPGTLRALATSADRTTCYFTDENGELCAWRPGQEPVPLLASAGPGPVSAVRRAGAGGFGRGAGPAGHAARAGHLRRPHHLLLHRRERGTVRVAAGTGAGPAARVGRSRAGLRGALRHRRT